MLEWKVSRHRRLCSIAIMQRDSVIRRGRKAGIRPGCELQGAVPCASMVAGRRTCWFINIGAGAAGSSNEWRKPFVRHLTRWRYDGRKTNYHSACRIGSHKPILPMAAHQLDLDFGGATAIRHHIASLTAADESRKPAPPNYNSTPASTDGVHGPIRPMAAHQLERGL